MDSCPRARLCQLHKWDDYTGYGFSLKSIKGRIGNSICDVDPESPAYAGGVRNGDLVVEVNGVNVLSEPHMEVVERIKSDPDRVCLLVVDPEARHYFQKHHLVVDSHMEQLDHIVCPSSKPVPSMQPKQDSHFKPSDFPDGQKGVDHQLSPRHIEPQILQQHSSVIAELKEIHTPLEEAKSRSQSDHIRFTLEHEVEPNRVELGNRDHLQTSEHTGSSALHVNSSGDVAQEHPKGAIIAVEETEEPTQNLSNASREKSTTESEEPDEVVNLRVMVEKYTQETGLSEEKSREHHLNSNGSLKETSLDSKEKDKTVPGILNTPQERDTGLCTGRKRLQKESFTSEHSEELGTAPALVRSSEIPSSEKSRSMESSSLKAHYSNHNDIGTESTPDHVSMKLQANHADEPVLEITNPSNHVPPSRQSNHRSSTGSHSNEEVRSSVENRSQHSENSENTHSTSELDVDLDRIKLQLGQNRRKLRAPTKPYIQRKRDFDAL